MGALPIDETVSLLEDAAHTVIDAAVQKKETHEKHRTWSLRGLIALVVITGFGVYCETTYRAQQSEHFKSIETATGENKQAITDTRTEMRAGFQEMKSDIRDTRKDIKDVLLATMQKIKDTNP